MARRYQPMESALMRPPWRDRDGLAPSPALRVVAGFPALGLLIEGLRVGLAAPFAAVRADAPTFPEGLIRSPAADGFAGFRSDDREAVSDRLVGSDALIGFDFDCGCGCSMRVASTLLFCKEGADRRGVPITPGLRMNLREM